MSDAGMIANDAAPRANAPREAIWSRKRNAASPDGGGFYGEALSYMLSFAARQRLRKARVSLTPLQNAGEDELRRIIGERRRRARRDDGDLDALETLAAAIGEAAARQGVEAGRDRAVHFAASRAVAGRNVALLRQNRRDCAIIIGACISALLNERTYVVSCDDARAAALFKMASSLYRMLGVDVALIEPDAARTARRAAYDMLVVHVGASSLAGDFLSDLELTGAEARGLRSAVASIGEGDKTASRLMRAGAGRFLIDGGDKVLTTVAARPVIIAGEEAVFERTAFAEEAIAFARRLTPGEDFVAEDLSATLTTAGRARARRISSEFSPLWNGETRREELLEAALAALHLFHPEWDYLVGESGVSPSTPDCRSAFADAVHDVPMEMLVSAKEDVLDQKAKRIRRSAPVRTALKGQALTGAVSCPGAGVAGELWRTYGAPSIECESGSAIERFQTVDIAKTPEIRLERLARKASQLLEIHDRVAVVASAREADRVRAALSAADNAADLQDRLCVVAFAEAVENMPTLTAAGAILLTTAGALDEDWRDLLDRLAGVEPSADIHVLMDEEDPLFGFLPDAARLQATVRLLGRWPALRLRWALMERRRKFSDYRTMQFDHLKTMDRVLAFGGGATGR